MSNVFYLRPIEPPVAPQDVLLTDDAGGCFRLHRVDWKQSFLRADGGRMLCWYQAPDAESVRLALRQLQANMSGVWPGSVAGNDRPDAPAPTDANFLAELRFPAQPQARDLDALIAGLEHSGVTFVRAFASTQEPMCVCVVHATSDEAVREGLGRTAVSTEAVWPCTPITPREGKTLE